MMPRLLLIMALEMLLERLQTAPVMALTVLLMALIQDHPALTLPVLTNRVLLMLLPVMMIINPQIH
jgi:hypothetical protein